MTAGKEYTIVISYEDELGKDIHLAQEQVMAASSREALELARGRSRKYRTGEIWIVRGAVTVTGMFSPQPDRQPAMFMDDEIEWTAEESLNQSFEAIL